jgi:hypothetical protein
MLQRGIGINFAYGIQLALSLGFIFPLPFQLAERLEGGTGAVVQHPCGGELTWRRLELRLVRAFPLVSWPQLRQRLILMNW